MSVNSGYIGIDRRTTRGGSVALSKHYLERLSGRFSSITPASISGCQLWLDAHQITGLADGDPVATWADASGNARDVSEATNRPTYQTSEINGLPVVRFDGSNDRLEGADNAVWQFTDFTMYAVVRFAGFHAGYYQNTIVSQDNSSKWMFCYKNETGTTHFHQNPGGTELDSTAWTAVVGTWYLVGCSRNATTVSFRTNGEAKGTATHGTQLPDVSGPLIIGVSEGATINADIAEIVLYNAAISAGDTTELEDYFNSKYAIY